MSITNRVQKADTLALFWKNKKIYIGLHNKYIFLSICNVIHFARIGTTHTITNSMYVTLTFTCSYPLTALFLLYGKTDISRSYHFQIALFVSKFPTFRQFSWPLWLRQASLLLRCFLISFTHHVCKYQSKNTYCSL